MKYAVLIVVTLLGLVALLAVQAYLASRGEREQFTNPDRQPQRFGQTGPTLSYMVMGDSTAAGQGTPAGTGIADRTAQKLALGRKVTLTNVAVSGATMSDVANDQIAVAELLKPELVLIAASANNVTKLNTAGQVSRELEITVDRLISANCNVKIVVIGSPDFGGVHRFAQPLRTVAGWRSARITGTIEGLAERRQLTFAPIAERTGPAFREDPTLLAADKYHPNERGYALWLPVLDEALAEALTQQPSHCG